MPKSIGNIVVPCDGDGGRKDKVDTKYAKNVEDITTMVAKFLQGDNTLSKFGTEDFIFQVNPLTNKPALYHKTGDGWLHKLDFGSVETDWFISTIAMGGLMYRYKDGWCYNIARISPVGDGRSVVMGNYAADSFIATTSKGAHITYELGLDHLFTVETGKKEKVIRGRRFESLLTSNAPYMDYRALINCPTQG